MRKTPLEEGLRRLEQAEEDLKWAGRAVELAREAVEFVRQKLAEQSASR